MRHVEKEPEYGNVSGFIMSLLNQCELIEPNGAPLFTYQLSVDSYANLKSQLQARVPSSASFKNVHWCAAFCLFGAEWYRREYQSGWSWSGIFDVLGFELEPIQRADVVIKGLTYWKRPINRYESNRNDYLGSLFSEGGLPFTLLASEGGRFQTMFKRLLTEFDRAKSFGVPPIPLIEKQLKGMPDAFQAESTITLLHDMVSNLYALIDTYNLEEKIAPSEYLDSVIKNWRINFPIPLDTETGDKLLTGLLNSAAAQRKEKKRQRKRLSLSQWLSNTSDLSFSANVEVSKQLALPVTRNDLTAPVVEVLIFEGNSKIADLGMARAELSNQGMMLHMRKTEVSFKRDHHEAALSVVIMVAGKVAYLEEIPGSALPLLDMPIVLKREDERLIVIGCGSVSEKADMLTVLIPNDVEVDPSEARLVASEQLNEFQKQTFTGELTINYTGDDIADTYHVSNKSDAYHRESLEIKGEEIEFPSQGGYPVYKGMPTILCHHPHARVYIGDCEVGKAQSLGEIFGRQVLRVKAEGKTLYRRKIAILPRDLEISLRPGTKPNLGSIAITSEKAFIYNVDTGIETKSCSEQGVKYIELISDSVPPVYVNLQIQANLLADPISLAIPFPCRGALVFDATGNELPRHCAINDLLGARILLFRAPHMRRTGFDIELKAPTSARDNPSYVFHYEVQKSVEEVSLFELRERIKELLATAQNHELDEVVRVIISGQGFGFKQYTVGWHAVSGKLEGNNLSFSSQEVKDLSTLKVELINLADPNEKPEVLTQRLSEGAPIGIFELPHHRITPKLAVPQKKSLTSFRAVYIPPTESITISETARSLEKAAQHFHPVRNPDAFVSVLDAMAEDLEHSGWRYLDKLLENHSHLPIATFEVWKALSKHSACLALLPFATKLNVEKILEVLQTEFSVTWELTPLHRWQSAQNRYELYLEKLSFPEPLIAKYLQDKNKALTDFMALPELFSVNTRSKEMYPILVNTWKDELHVNRSTDRFRWPQYYEMELNASVCSNFSELALFEVPHKFKTSVMYFPIVAAAVVSARTTWQEVLGTTTVNYFLLRQLMEFDRDWFNSVFQCALSFLRSDKR